MFASATSIAQTIKDFAFGLDGIVFLTLFGYGVTDAVRRRNHASAWFAGMFGVLVFVLVAGRISDHLASVNHDDSETTLGHIVFAAITLVPFCLYRFTRVFSPGARVIDVMSGALTVALVAGTLIIDVPPPGEHWSLAPALLVGVFLAHWTLLSAISAMYFFIEAQRTAGVSARRMRLFAWAALMLAAALLLSGSGGFASGAMGTALVQLAGATAAILFWFALAPPRALRAMWRSAESENFNHAVRSLLSGEDNDAVRQRLLQSATRMTGGRGAVLLDATGAAIAWSDIDEAGAHALASLSARESAALTGGRIVVGVGPATPFFGAEERRLLDTLSAFGQLAEERAGLLTLERQANQRLREVDQLKTEFVAMVAHDLRSPMSVISGFADTIRDRWDDLTDERKLQFLDLISRNTHSLAVFVEDVLQVARLESGQFHYDLVPFEPRAVVDRIVAEFGLAHPELQLEIDAPADIPEALGDAERNWQILTNLLTNAVKFSENDPRVQVELRYLDNESAVSIAVRDHGVGISEEDQPRLFQRFSRVGERRSMPGTGLGLYIVKSMVEAQGGRIWVQSTPGAGSTFTYTLPAVLEQSA
ncbi:MAG: two-component sensor histidine kinase [Thermoleophilia bacterium]|nr:two-component sensor histidine kinase [Thermoleophilia bacterium]